jgi:enolase-phosphatase E1
MPAFHNYSAILLDIEGTTTSIRFVYEVLFPYAREHLSDFLTTHWDTPAVQADVAQVIQQVAADQSEGLTPPTIPSSAAPAVLRAAVVANLLWQMDLDRKTTGLKSLQGRIWRGGYESGAIQGHIYPDVPGALRGWADDGVPVFIYSSGSVAAQKLLFGHSEAGDLLPLLRGHFDTTIGDKKAADSYATIAAALGVAPDRIVFSTDSLAEAKAAHAAGLQVALSVRPGNPPLPDGHGFTLVHSTAEIRGGEPAGMG